MLCSCRSKVSQGLPIEYSLDLPIARARELVRCFGVVALEGGLERGVGFFGWILE